MALRTDCSMLAVRYVLGHESRTHIDGMSRMEASRLVGVYSLGNVRVYMGEGSSKR